jgi:ribonuclease R
MNEQRRAHYEQILPAVALQSSERERRADEIERETVKLKKAEYMFERIGETYDGVISSVTAWGIYVELPNTIEGMVHVASLSDDYYHYREQSYEMVGERTGKSYKLGQNVTVRVESVDMLTRTIDFEILC